jgi:hypothetical protein
LFTVQLPSGVSRTFWQPLVSLTQFGGTDSCAVHVVLLVKPLTSKSAGSVFVAVPSTVVTEAPGQVSDMLNAALDAMLVCFFTWKWTVRLLVIVQDGVPPLVIGMLAQLSVSE